MAGVIQLGDVINFSKLAWEVYQFGWQEEFNATKQYTDFGRDVKDLAESLDILARIVRQAGHSLQVQAGVGAQLRWDKESLKEIIGDYAITLYECRQLLEKNQQYRMVSSARRNIEWNVLVQPTADRLRQRIQLHNSKILHVLKPFEIDLLCRIHQDLAHRINAVHTDLRTLIGVLVPNLGQALEQQKARETRTIQVPQSIADALYSASVRHGPPTLQEMADAFVSHFADSTIDFKPGLFAEDKIPPVEEYLSLLKCAWLMEQMQNDQNLPDAKPDSHWPSYIQQLQEDLSVECDRFTRELTAPNIAHLDPYALTIWPEKKDTELIDIVTEDVMMEEVLDRPLRSGPTITRNVRLRRRMGADSRKFQMVISGSERVNGRYPREQAIPINFDINTVILNPLYTIPYTGPENLDMILRKDDQTIKLSFTELKHVLELQQALTGYKAWGSYCKHNVTVSFVLSGRKDPLFEQACLQVWIPKQKEGKLVTNTSSDQTRSDSKRTSSAFQPLPSPLPQSDNFFGTNDPFSINSNDSNGLNIDFMRGASPMPFAPGSPNSMFSTQIPSMQPPIRPYPDHYESSNSLNESSRNSRRRSSILSQFWGGSKKSSMSAFKRSSSISSHNFAGPSSDSTYSSNSSGDHTVPVTVGAGGTGYIHSRPMEPLLVLFTRDVSQGKLSIVTIQLDEKTAVNPERCTCRLGGHEGAACTIAAIEREKGSSNLDARRFETREGDANWSVARLALARRGERQYTDAAWKNVKRVSIMFEDKESRAEFGGNRCRCDVKVEKGLRECLAKGHQGLLGDVREFHRLQTNEYYRIRHETRRQVVTGMREDRW